MISRLYLLMTILLGFFAPSNIFSQNNRVSIHSGLFHSFFDGSPILNMNYRNKAVKPFNGLFYNSVGIQYERKMNSKTSLSFEYNYYYEIYENIYSNFLTNTVFKRENNTFNVNYNRFFSINDRLDTKYGGGLNYRHGRESVVVGYHEFSYIGGHEILLEPRFQNDIGINIRGGIDYYALPWLTLFSNFDLLGFIYLHDRKAIKKIQEAYEYNDYPHRFDLSWRFGIGFNL